MSLNAEHRRDILSMCCVVARADGIIAAGEYERLIELLAELGQGSVGFEELQQWLDNGPPAPAKKLPEEHLKLFLHEAVGIAHADGNVSADEIATIKRLVNLCFENAERYK
jgi:tellurite resistance protein